MADTLRIKSYLTALTKKYYPRNYEHKAVLDSCAAFIRNEFSRYSKDVFSQSYVVEGKTYQNVICSFGVENADRIVVGAHYDVCGEQAGADDNASGVAGLLELARLLKEKKLRHRIDLVAYSLEEPPFFRTNNMGSYIHAKSLYDSKIKVTGMVSLEMLGYFSDQPHSQKYPVGILSLIYGSKGDYITLVKKFGSGKFARKFGRQFRKSKTVKSKKFSGPASLPGIDFSDHLNYWKFGYSALMITDTSFYRNKNYHQAGDTLEKLDLHRMAKVIDGVCTALTAL